MTERLDFHPIANIFPLIDGPEFEALVKDIRDHGQREPITLYEGKILDGRNRYRACDAAGVDAWLETFSSPDPVAFVISKNIARRHLDASQRAMVAAKLATLKEGRPGKAANLRSTPSAAEAAAMLNVSTRTVEVARVVRREGVPELQAAVESGAVSVAAAAEVSRLPEDEQRKTVAAGKSAVKALAKSARTKRVAKRAERTREQEWSSPSAPKETQHDRDLAFLRGAWDAACASARAAFIRELGYEPLKGEAA